MAGLRRAAFAAVIVRAKAAATRNASLRDIVNALQHDSHLVYATPPRFLAAPGTAASFPVTSPRCCQDHTGLDRSALPHQQRTRVGSGAPRIHVPHSGQGLVMTIHLNDVGEHAI